jgi:fructose-1,6-bisphosphatase/inositol monophosphatase family enzyme
VEATTDKFGYWTALGLEFIAEALALINELGGRGREVVSSQRDGDYRYWDPETLKVDQATEDLFIQKLGERGVKGVFLSEEAGRVELSGAKGGPDEAIYFVSDPFDGSLLYKRQIPAFWYTSLAIYGMDGRPRCAIVGDCIDWAVDFANEALAFSGKVHDGQLVEVTESRPTETTELSQAFVETYLMKPHYLYPTAIQYEPLLRKVKFILPNGGPGGFADVARGKVDVYVAFKQPFVDVFPGLAIAERAGATVTTFDGKPVTFEDKLEQRYDLICAATPALHEQVLSEIQQIQKGTSHAAA